jgi:hypothetical protein
MQVLTQDVCWRVARPLLLATARAGERIRASRVDDLATSALWRLAFARGVREAVDTLKAKQNHA